ncbi:MAG: PadR family transcriptional regulator [Gemmatimonadales bacterium]|nr:PadR family transcriptional regulator [Gemmatimonadales bacterium]
MPRGLGITSLQILAAARAESAYGLDIVVRTGLPAGTVYPTLGRLRDAGLVKTHWEDQRVADREGRPRRRFYTLTASGNRALAAGADQLRATAAALRTALALPTR